MAFTKIAAAGIGTTETVTVDGLTVINNGSFGGNLSVGGTLTYEDVTNVDSVGLITARSGINVGSGITLSPDGDIFAVGIATFSKSGTAVRLTDGSILRLGNEDADFFLYHDGSSTDYISAGTGKQLRLTTDDFIIKGAGNSETLVTAVKDGAVTLYNDNSAKLATSASGVTVTGTVAATSYTGDGSALTGIAATDNVRTGILDVAGVGTFRNDVNIPDKIIHLGDTNTAIRFPAADTITAETGGSERARIDSAGRLGIGENSPSAQLHVSTPASTTCEIRLTSNNTGSGSGDRGRINVYSSRNDGTAYQAGYVDIDRSSGTEDKAHLLVALNNGSGVGEKLRITSTGDMGLGTSSPIDFVELKNSTAQKKLVLSKSNSGSADENGMWLQFNNYGPSGTARAADTIIGKLHFYASQPTSGNLQDAGAIECRADGNQTGNNTRSRLSFLTVDSQTATERLRIHSSGQVSVGEDTSDSHDYKFVVKPNRSDTTKAALGLLVDGDSGQGGGVASESISAKIVNTNTFNNSTHQYAAYIVGGQQYTAPVTACYVSASGTYNATIGMKVELNKSINANTDGFSIYSKIVESNSGSGVAYHFRGEDNGNIRINIEKDGDIKNTNNSYGSLSDVKLKENIVDANSQWDDIKALRIRNFNFKDDPDKVKLLGVVAQEAEVVSAGLVDTSNDIETDATTGEGTVTGTTKYVKYSILYMKAVKALQEAQTRIETLETKVAALEG